MPWLSSIGKLENVFAGSHPITPPPPAEQQGDLAKKGSTLEAHNMRLLGRVGIRQPILHVYTFRGQTTIQFSFADWLYNPPTCDGRKMHRTKVARRRSELPHRSVGRKRKRNSKGRGKTSSPSGSKFTGRSSRPSWPARMTFPRPNSVQI